jgi:hypothetical protein
MFEVYVSSTVLRFKVGAALLYDTGREPIATSVFDLAIYAIERLPPGCAKPNCCF